MSVVSNASPIINLSKIGLFSLLQQLFGQIHLTQAVYDELVIDGQGLPGSDEVAQARGNWIEVHPTASNPELKPLQAKFTLSKPDASVIVLAQQLQAERVVIDEPNLRKAARQFNLRVTGAGGILLRAKQLNLIPEVRDPLERAIASGLRMNEEIKKRILKQAGEL